MACLSAIYPSRMMIKTNIYEPSFLLLFALLLFLLADKKRIGQQAHRILYFGGLIFFALLVRLHESSLHRLHRREDLLFRELLLDVFDL